MSGSDSRKELVEAEKWAIVAYSNFYRNEISLRLDSSGLDSSDQLLLTSTHDEQIKITS